MNQEQKNKDAATALLAALLMGGGSGVVGLEVTKKNCDEACNHGHDYKKRLFEARCAKMVNEIAENMAASTVADVYEANVGNSLVPHFLAFFEKKLGFEILSSTSFRTTTTFCINLAESVKVEAPQEVPSEPAVAGV